MSVISIRWIDVGVFDIAVAVGSGMTGFVFQTESGTVGLHLAEFDHLSVERAIEFAAKGRNLAAVGIGAGRCGVESALAMFSEMMRIRPACARKPEAAIVSVLMKSTVALPWPLSACRAQS